jgi:hypothetical protein
MRGFAAACPGPTLTAEESCHPTAAGQEDGYLPPFDPVA